MRLNLSNAAALATLAALAGPSFSAAQEPPTGGAPSEGAEFLLLPVGARAVGMGGAVTGMRGIGELVLWNPAGVASMADRRLLFNHSESAFDTRSDVLSLAWPMRSIGTFGLTYYLVDYGELTSTDPGGSVTGTINFRNQEFLVTYATRIAGPLEFGINYKLIQLIFRCDGVCAGTQSFTRTTHAFDFGLIWDGVAGVPLSLGGSLRHLGFPLQGEDEDDPLPTRVRVGIAYQALSAFTADSLVTLVLTLDLEDQTRDLGAPEVMIGSEFGVTDLFFIRAGYAFLDTGFGGPTLGLGVTYDWFYLDLSRGFDEISSATGEDAVQVSFGIIF
ncbi:MAG: PorV/PorQ family protein [Gemmatimonadetes bacterium]|nr:PorV/PorQ family protein [Gemmatimonadota bacterium]NIO30888.1 PorV/PorQ family protein [Gemmatimonadota bacterium]